MENFTEIATELVRIYNLHKGKEFEAHYQGERKMPLKGTMRDVLEIDEGNPFASTLAEISSTVHQIKNTVLKFGKESLGLKIASTLKIIGYG